MADGKDLALRGALTALARLRACSVDDPVPAALAATELALWIAMADDADGLHRRSTSAVVQGFRYLRDRTIHAVAELVEVGIVDDFYTDVYTDQYVGRWGFTVHPKVPPPSRKRYLKPDEQAAYRSHLAGQDIVRRAEEALDVLGVALRLGLTNGSGQ